MSEATDPRRRIATGLTVAGYRLAIRLAAAVPPGVAYPVLDRAADLVRRQAHAARAAVDANLLQVIGRRDRRHARAVRGVFRHTLRNYYDTFRLPAMTDAEVRAMVVVEGVERLRQALDGGRGAILFTPHVSSVLIGAQALALAERGGTVAVEPLDPPELLELMLRVRGSHGLRFSPLGPRLFGELTETLRRNELAFLVVDRDLGGSGIVVPFFGRPARLPSGPALLALRTGAPLLPALMSRRPDGRLQGTIGEPLALARGGDRREAVRQVTGLVIAQLEYHIARYPEQWTVLQRVWP